MAVKIARHTGEVARLDTVGRGVVRHRANLSTAKALGQAGAVLGQLGDRLAEKQEKLDEFNARNQYSTFKQRVAEDIAVEAENMAPDGSGFHAGYMGGNYQKLQQEFIGGIKNERLREQFEALTGEGGSGYTLFDIETARAERDRLYAHTDEGVQTQTTGLSAQIDVNREGYNTFLQEGMELIDAAPRSDIWKRGKKRDWQAMAQAALINATIRDDAEEAYLMLGYGTEDQNFAHLVKRVVRFESANDPTAESPAGALGLMQVMPGTAREIAKEIGDDNYPFREGQQPNARITNAEKDYLTDPNVSIAYGSHYLMKQLKKYANDPKGRGLEAALIAYNAGPGNANKWLAADGDYSVLPKREETEVYVARVMGNLGASAHALGGSPASGVSFSLRNKDRTGYEPVDLESKGLAKTSRDLLGRVQQAFASIGETEVKLNSGFRGKSENKAAGGVEHSQHLLGNAVDINVSHLDETDRIRVIQSLSAAGIGGIGVGANTIHADIGSRRSWGYNGPNGKAGGPVPEWARGVIAKHQSGTLTKNDLGIARVDPRMQGLSAATRAKWGNQARNAMVKNVTEDKTALAFQKAQYQSWVESDIASREATGTGNPDLEGVSDESLVATLGVPAYAKLIEDRQVADNTYRGRLAVLGANSDEEIDGLLEGLAPAHPNFAVRQKIFDKTKAFADEIQAERKTDPDKAALRYQNVQDAEAAALSQPSPASYQNFVNVMLEQQKAIGIPESKRQTLSADVASQVGEQLVKAPEGEDLNAEQAFTNFLRLKGMFGDRFTEVLEDMEGFGGQKGWADVNRIAETGNIELAKSLTRVVNAGAYDVDAVVAMRMFDANQDEVARTIFDGRTRRTEIKGLAPKGNSEDTDENVDQIVQRVLGDTFQNQPALVSAAREAAISYYSNSAQLGAPLDEEKMTEAVGMVTGGILEHNGGEGEGMFLAPLPGVTNAQMREMINAVKDDDLEGAFIGQSASPEPVTGAMLRDELQLVSSGNGKYNIRFPNAGLALDANKGGLPFELDIKGMMPEIEERITAKRMMSFRDRVGEPADSVQQGGTDPSVFSPGGALSNFDPETGEFRGRGAPPIEQPPQ